MKWIFTYGYDHPSHGGWAEVKGVKTRDDAIALFNIFHEPRNGFVACAGIYTEVEFRTTKMYLTGNLGKRCVERITVSRTEGDFEK